MVALEWWLELGNARDGARHKERGQRSPPEPASRMRNRLLSGIFRVMTSKGASVRESDFCPAARRTTTSTAAEIFDISIAFLHI